MKDVGWGDFLVALIVAPILVLPVVGAVYLLLFVVMEFDTGDFSSWFQITTIITCVAEGFVVASRYEGPEGAIDHEWAWMAVVAMIAAAAAGLYIGGLVSAESAYVYAMALYNYVAWAFMIAMLSVFFNTRGRQVDPIDRKRMELEHSATIVMLRK